MGFFFFFFHRIFLAQFNEAMCSLFVTRMHKISTLLLLLFSKWVFHSLLGFTLLPIGKCFLKQMPRITCVSVVNLTLYFVNSVTKHFHFQCIYQNQSGFLPFEIDWIRNFFICLVLVSTLILCVEVFLVKKG